MVSKVPTENKQSPLSIKHLKFGVRDGSAIKYTCSCRGSRFSPHHSSVGSQTATGALTTSANFERLQAAYGAYIHADKILKHGKKRNIKRKRSIILSHQLKL